MKNTILNALIISCMCLSSYAMENKQEIPKETSEFPMEQIPDEVLSIILSQVVTQDTLDKAIDQIKTLKKVNRRFNEAIRYIFPIEKLAKQFDFPPRAVALRLIKKLNLTKDQKQALLNKYPTNPSLDESLFKAIKANNIEKLKELLKQNANVNAIELIKAMGLIFRITPLIQAAKIGNTNIVKLLLQYGASKGKDLALDYAIKNNHQEVVDLLKQAGAKE